MVGGGGGGGVMSGSRDKGERESRVRGKGKGEEATEDGCKPGGGGKGVREMGGWVTAGTGKRRGNEDEG
jgi:hypothetical protein